MAKGQDKLEAEDSSKIQRNFVITKKIASHGSQSIIIVPKCLNSQLKPGMLAEIKINLIGGEDGK